MDYASLAKELMDIMFRLKRQEVQKEISNSMQGEAFILQYLYFSKGIATPSEISEVMRSSTARVAATLKTLENKGCITRNIDVNDRRRILVKLTLTGKERAEEQVKMIYKITENMLRYLGENDAKEHIRIMSRLAERSLESFL